MADRLHGHPAPVTETEIRHECWDGEELSGQSHARVAFVEVDMTGVRDRGAEFTECAFRDCKLNASTHHDAAFVNCTFTRCNFFNAEFTRCKLVGTMFDRCSLDLLKCVEGDWSFVGLPGADLRSASFLRTRMQEADLTGARCQGASFRDVDLARSLLARSDFSGADLRGSDVSSIDPLSVRLEGTVIDPDQAIAIAAALGLDVQPDEEQSS